MFCSRCGSDNETNNNFCHNCGNKHNESKPKKSRSYWLYGIITAIVLFLCFNFYEPETPTDEMENTVRNQLHEIRQNHLTKAYYDYSSDELKKSITLEQFRQFLQDNSYFTKAQSIDFQTKEAYNNLGLLKGTLRTSDHKLIPIQFEMIKNDNEWRVLGIIPMPGEIVSDTKSQVISPEDQILTIEAQLAALENNQIDSAYDTYASSDFKKETSKETFSRFVSQFPLLTSHQTVEVRQHQILGQRATLTVLIKSDSGSLPIEYQLVEEDGKWKIWNMRILTPLAEQTPTNEQDSAILISTIEKQLTAIKSGNINEAYENTSSGFKATTSLSEFKKFIQKFPAFSQGSPRYKNQHFEKGIGRVSLELKSGDQTTEIDYIIAPDGDEWKVWGMQVTKMPLLTKESSEQIPDFDASIFKKTIGDQLSTLKKGDINQAYNSFTSTDFQKSTSLDEFINFIHHNPIFSEHATWDFPTLMFNNNIAVLKGTLSTSGGGQVKVQYDLIKENNSWKVLAIKILPDNQVSYRSDSTTTLDFPEALIGTIITPKGDILNPTSKIGRLTKEFYATIKVNQTQSGEKMTIVMEHAPSGASLAPISTTLDAEGPHSVPIVFTAPPSGWPTGKYLLKINLSGGSYTEFPFEIIE